MNFAIMLLTATASASSLSPPNIQSRSSFLHIVKDYYLEGHVMDSRETSSVLSCAQLCLKTRPVCRSLNYGNKDGNMVCELNDEGIDTAEAGSTSLVPMPGFIFGQLLNLMDNHYTNDTSEESENKDYKFTFTTLGALGTSGPTDTSWYQGTTLQQKVTLDNGIQIWQVPVSGSYVIKAWGASGAEGRQSGDLSAAARPGGKGAYMRGTFNLNRGTKLKILVGQAGSTGTTGVTLTGGGGGGTFVTSLSNTPLIVAGGGGRGVARTGIMYEGDPGQTTGYGSRAGGSSGSGGNLYEKYFSIGSFESGAGGGLNGDGKSGRVAEGGKGFVNGGEGGGTRFGANGGFGGGGAGHMFPGAGGGYSGGGVLKDGSEIIAGGGGSFNSGADPVKKKGVKKGDGKAIITLLDPDKRYT